MRKRDYVMNMLPGSGWEINGNISYEWNNFMDGFTVSEEFATFGANLAPNNNANIYQYVNFIKLYPDFGGAPIIACP